MPIIIESIASQNNNNNNNSPDKMERREEISSAEINSDANHVQNETPYNNNDELSEDNLGSTPQLQLQTGDF